MIKFDGRNLEMKKGDRVSVIDDKLKGTVTHVDGDTCTVEDEHGFEYRFRISDLVLQQTELYEMVPLEIKKDVPKAISRKHHKKPLVLDLHFEKLVTDPSGYTSAERLFIQKEKLTASVEYCRKNNLKKLEIIHGIGNGVVQNMVHEFLEGQTGLEFHNKEILHDQSGTVMVYFT